VLLIGSDSCRRQVPRRFSSAAGVPGADRRPDRTSGRPRGRLPSWGRVQAPSALSP